MTDPLRLYDSLSATTLPFEPAEVEVRLYVCGVTPYDTAHLGHAFTYVSFDVLIRYLEYRGYSVRYVQNVTDIDDPLFAKAHELGVSYQDLAVRETEQYLLDMAALRVRAADVYPRASKEIPEMIAIAEALVQGGYAYVRNGHVYFDVSSDPDYGVLSKYDRTQMLALTRERGGDPDDPRKGDPLDFLLWRPSTPGEPTFPSPWGDGLPGWHLECSAMSLKYLGLPLDIHGGGEDLLFPHHESEIAQSQAVSGKQPLAHHWMHTAMVYMDGEKMSKSLGNMVFARDLVRQYSADAVRVYISSTHYRSELHWDPADLEAAAAVAATLRSAARLPPTFGRPLAEVQQIRDNITAALSNDLDTPHALTCLAKLAAAMAAGFDRGENIEAGRQTLLELGGVLGLTLEG